MQNRFLKFVQTTSKSLQTKTRFNFLNVNQYKYLNTTSFTNQQRFLFSQDPKESDHYNKSKQILSDMDQKSKITDEQGQSQYEDDASFEREDSNSLYIFGLGAFALGLGYIVMQVNILRHNKKTGKDNSINKTYTGKADIGGPWELLDLNGQKFTDKDLKGSYYLIYFGFCNCPDICPNSLHKLAKGLKKMDKMPEAKYIDLKTVFVSVDPDRDDYLKIQRFLDLFDYPMIGLTSTNNEDPKLKDMLRKFRIYSTKIEYEMMDEEEKAQTKKISKNMADFKNAYTIDHTVLTYLMDDNNEYVTHLGSNLNEHELASTIMEKILDNERNKIKKMQQ